MNFKAAFYNPFKPYAISLGEISADKIVETFEKIPWEEYLQKMVGKKDNDIHYSPSLEITKEDTKNVLTISATGTPENIEYYIFYRHSKKVKRFFGLSEKVKENYLSEVSKQTRKDAFDCLLALIQNDSEFLDTKFKN